MKALSIRQPWAWLIVHGGKDVENRTWTTKFRGRFLIHAAKGTSPREFIDAMMFAANNCRADIDLFVPLATMEKGGIVGEAEIVDCVTESSSPWFVGPHGFVIRNVKPLPFRPCKGALGFFTPEGLR